MQKLSLLFTKGGLQSQANQPRNNPNARNFFLGEGQPESAIKEHLATLLNESNAGEISVISALNHFTLMPEGFSQHDMANTLLAYNAPVEADREEVMLSVNRKFGVQFYYAFPKDLYELIKSKNIPTKFNFSGEKFLNTLTTRGGKEIHINLYHQQCEFIALDRKKLVLYNNLDISSEVDFLYFVMFTLSKIGFGVQETQFFIYGETTENDTFISELQKFVKNLKIVFDNLHGKNFILT